MFANDSKTFFRVFFSFSEKRGENFFGVKAAKPVDTEKVLKLKEYHEKADLRT